MDRRANSRGVYFTWSALFIILSVCSLASEKPVSDKCKEISIRAAQLCKEAYLQAKMAYFYAGTQKAKLAGDTAKVELEEAMLCVDSCLALAPDSNFLAESFLKMAKKEIANGISYLKFIHQEEKAGRKKNYAWGAVSCASQAVADAYHASFYFEGATEPEKKPEPVNPPAEKHITKLDVDQALFVLYNEQLHEKEEANKAEIGKLNEKLKVTKDAASVAKIKDELKKLEKKEEEYKKKDMETSEKISQINSKLDEQHKDPAKEKIAEGTVFDKDINKNNTEWNKSIVMDKELPDGLVYQVQIGVYKNNISPEIFKGITPVYGKTVPGGISYATGMFEKASDAQQARTYVKSIGLHDAFVVAFYNKKKITMAEAAKLEKK